MKGIYCLVIEIRNKCTVSIGALGNIEFDKGMYVYVGSAQNNLEKRIERHLSVKKKTRWHIDYLLAGRNISIGKVYYKNTDKTEECAIAKKLSGIGMPIRNFGSSDCKCESHLIKIGSMEVFESLKMKTYIHRS